MNRKWTHALFAATLAGLCVTGGCAGHGFLDVDCCADIPEGAIPEPAGVKTCQWQIAQVENAFADQLTLYRCDFVGETSQLSPAAIERINRLAHTDSASQSRWFIEPSGDARVDQERLKTVVFHLDDLGSPPQDVVIASPPALGLTGLQAERVAASFGQGSNRNSRTGSSTNANRRSSRSSF